jgi:OmpA-OmpF porin, OOP family
MSSKNVLQKWQTSAAVLSLLAFLSASCGAEVRNPALERGRNAYERVRRDPAVAGRAAVSLEKTRSTLEEAERVWAEEKDANEVEHLVYLTEKRAEIALATARRRIAADEIQQLKPQR